MIGRARSPIGERLLPPGSEAANTMTYRVGIDIGGTFTDIVFLAEDGTVLTVKLPSTPMTTAAASPRALAGSSATGGSAATSSTR